MNIIVGICLRYNINKEIHPVKQHYRRIPIALLQEVENEIDSLLKLGIIEKVDLSEWISPMVIETKKKVDLEKEDEPRPKRVVQKPSRYDDFMEWE